MKKLVILKWTKQGPNSTHHLLFFLFRKGQGPLPIFIRQEKTKREITPVYNLHSTLLLLLLLHLFTDHRKAKEPEKNQQQLWKRKQQKRLLLNRNHLGPSKLDAFDFISTKLSYLQHLQTFILKSPSVPFLPNMPPQVNNNAIEAPSVISRDLPTALPPELMNRSWHTELQAERLNQVLICAQACCVKGQSKHRCVVVSGWVWHSLQIGSCGQCLLARLSAIKIFLGISVHAKDLHFGSADALHNGVILSLQKVPSNWIW